MRCSGLGPIRASLSIVLLAMGLALNVAQAGDSLQKEFASPPATARPWVYWFWLNSNITREGITADLEAMQRVGIGGVLIMEVDQGAPTGAVAFGGPRWRELFKHVCSEADRLGLEINMSNDAGWCGSGGPWITPELSMQKMVWTEAQAEGPQHLDAVLAQPQKVANYYEDFSVVAFPTPAGNYRIPEIAGKSALNRHDFPPAPVAYAAVPADQTVAGGKQVDLSAQFKDGRLTWDVPPGKWTIIRFGHTSTGKDNHPAPETGRGLECDKLSTKAVDAMFAGLMGKIISDSKPLVGKSLVTTHIDSWEVHSQNWSPLLREEFQKRCGYDPYRYLPVITGRVVDSVEASERFLWDWRQTISDVLIANYAGHFQELAKQNGIKLSIEAYGDGPFDEITYGGRADEPMGEFWSWAYGGANESVTEMCSSGHVYGKRIIGAEAFTASDGEKWLGHPALIKTLGDWAFCEGINRFVFHRYAMQPWTSPTRAPGMAMGPWGLHYERTNTWWEQSKPWHEYLARCQHMLRQGLFVADICYLQQEGAPRSFGPPMARTGNPPDRPGYNFDGCSPDVVLNRMAVKDGRIVLPDGMSYGVLVLPEARTMTPRLLGKVAELVVAGATVVGPRPEKSPSLVSYPACDDEVRKIADRMWGDGDGKSVKEHALGKGRVIWGKTAEEALAGMGVTEDFVAAGGLRGNVRYIHRAVEDGTDLYFVANKKDVAVDGVCTFRLHGKRPEFWWPQTGRTELAAAYEDKDGVTRIPMRLESTESVFVVFQPGQAAFDPVASFTHDGQSIYSVVAAKPAIVIQKATYGVPGDATRTREVKAKLQALVDGGPTTFTVSTMAEGDDPAYMIVKTLAVEYTVDGTPHTATGQDSETMSLEGAAAGRVADLCVGAGGQLQMEAWLPGRYEATTASGKVFRAQVPAGATKAEELTGPWELQFPPKAGAPATVTLDTLISWSQHGDAVVRYFSGTATYRKTVTLPPDVTARGRAVYLDLGKVAVIAEVKLNGKDLGILWKSPYRVEVTDAVKPGDNTLEIKVTNLWINRMIGDEQLAEDSDRNGNGTLKKWPDWLEHGQPSPTGRYTFSSWRLWKKNSPLQESGLLGPVTVQVSNRVVLDKP
jgi:hypothetical protein